MSTAEAVALPAEAAERKGVQTFQWDNLIRVELEGANLLATALSNAEIASKLVLSVKTVATHLTDIYRKCQAATAAGCAPWRANARRPG